MRQTSILAFKSIKGDINSKQKIVLSVLHENHPMSDRQLAEKLNWPINTVTPRRGELVLMGKVEEVYKSVDPKTGRRAIFWRPAMVNRLEFEDVA